MDRERLKQVLRGLRDRYREEWNESKDDVFRKLEDFAEIMLLRDKLSSEDIEQLEKIWDEIPINFRRLFNVFFPADESERIRMYNDETIRKLMQIAKETNNENFEENLEKIAELMRKVTVRNVGVATLSSFVAVANPDMFMPTTEMSISSNLRDYIGIDRFIGGQSNVQKYEEFMKTVKEVADELEIGSMLEVAFYLSKYSGIGIAGVIAWSHNKWKGFDEEGYQRRKKYGFKFVKETGIAHEWWNFYEGFDDKWYYGHIEFGQKVPKMFDKGLILFISRNINDGKFYFVGFYGNAEIGKFNTTKKVHELLPKWYYKDKIPDIASNIREGDFREHLEKILQGEVDYVGNVKGLKEKSVVFREYIEVKPEDIGVRRFGQFSFTYLDKEQILKLLERAKTIHEQLLENISNEEERQEIQRILETINSVIKEVRDLSTENDEEKTSIIDENLRKRIDQILNSKKQIILYGPPGTGKTWTAQNYVMGETNNKKFYEFVTFHPSYSYEEFVEGLKPIPAEATTSGLKFIVEDGIFKKMVIKAICEALKLAENGNDLKNIAEELWNSLKEIENGNLNEYDRYLKKKRELWNCIRELSKNKEKLRNLFKSAPKFYLIIDEINRGDISRIFGELITLLEADKRLGEDNQIIVTLPYSKEPFGVPPNLFIIGTMNTADRSIALIDIALRRRFGFIELMPSYKILINELGIGNVNNEDDAIRMIESWNENDLNDVKKLAVKVLYSINKRIRVLYDRDHQIGHSYLLKLKDSENIVKTLEYIWYHEILPLLQEYFYDSPEKLGQVLNGKFVKVKRDRDKTTYEFVEESNFIDALKGVAKESES